MRHPNGGPTGRTAFTDMVGCRLPIQLAPMAGVGSTPALALAVADAGGHAMVPAVLTSPARLAELLDAVAARTEIFGVNFIGLLLDREALEVALERAPLIDFHFGTPEAGLVDRIHKAGALASWQVGSVEQARAAADAGCDLIVAQGCSAGGRLAGELELSPLLTQILAAVPLPVVAAGGIGTRAQAEAALAAGAAGVRIGTRFIASEESDAHLSWKRALLDARAADSVITRKFSAGVPELPHRILRSSLEAANAHEGEYVGEIDHDGRRVQVPRFASTPPTRDATGAVDAMPFYAGRSVDGVNSIQPAMEIVTELVGIPARRAAATSTQPEGGTQR